MRADVKAATVAARWLQELGWEFACGGALALRHWGRDAGEAAVEIFFWAGYGREAEFLEKILAGPWEQKPAEAQRLVQETRQCLVAVEGTVLRFIFCALPFERTMLDRAVECDVEQGSKLRLLSAEDLLLLTLFRLRLSAREDALSILRRQRGRLQWPYVDHWLPQLAALKDDERPLLLLEELRSGLARSG